MDLHLSIPTQISQNHRSEEDSPQFRNSHEQGIRHEYEQQVKEKMKMCLDLIQMLKDTLVQSKARADSAENEN